MRTTSIERLARAAAILAMLGGLAACSGASVNADGADANAAAARPVSPTPVKGEESYAVVEREVSFQAAGMTIHGTLTRPKMDGRFASVVLIAGSGPTDRDWDGPLLPGDNGSAALLARKLAAHGLVVLRYDKRGSGQTGMPEEPVSWEDYIAELQGAVALLAQEPVADPARITLAGHSEGAWHAIRFAQDPARREELAGLALLSPAGRSLATVVLEQIEAGLLQAGMAQEEVAVQVSAIEQAFEDISAGKQVDPAQVSALPGVQNLVASFQDPSARPFVQAILTYDPTQEVKTVGLPLLILSGGKDIQVDLERDARPLIEAAKGAELDVTVARPPMADHVLKVEEGDPETLDRATVGARYNAADRELDPQVVEAIVSWLQRL